ncbi:unnamed protein product [Leptidea sinapis]|uniref:3'-5' exonuclease domain-containing protein n=1 Tax=Leptidea sinapis TaxID=189913 RepID=A0A5E4QXB9_9NEOP|nr:unnamed protein product [Leptidea sinapis]
MEDSLKQFGFDVDIDKSVQNWLENLQTTWKPWKKSSIVDDLFKKIFDFDNPYRIALICVIKCPEYKDSNPMSLPYFIIESVFKWSQTLSKAPDDLFKLPAFHIAIMQKNRHFLGLIIKTFHLKTIKDKILPIIYEMMEKDNRKQAIQIVSDLELYDDIPIETLLFPLFLQDRLSVINEYLTDSPSQVLPLIHFLDSLLDRNCKIRNYVQIFLENNKVNNIKYNKIHYKPLGKYVARLCNKFNIPIETCQNLSRNRTAGGLKYLINQKYVEHKVSASVWDDLVKDNLKNSEGFGIDFIYMLMEFDQSEALKWAKYLNISENDLPSTLRPTVIPENILETTEEVWESQEIATKQYYKYPLSANSIIMVSDGEQFYDIMSTLEKCEMVSIDCEWKPSFGAAQSQVALIQVATFSCVYLIDTLILNDKKYASFWYTFNKHFLDNDEIIKLGFGIEQDLKEMKVSIVGLQNIKTKGAGFLDLAGLWKGLVDAGLILPRSNDVSGKGLSSLVESCFGVPLEKSEQCSNWELRPLRTTQINYAALDAYVLLEIYTYFKKLCAEQNIDFEVICNDIMIDKKSKHSKKSKTAGLPPPTNIEQRQVKDLKILVERELSYLLSYLRYCGFDTVVMPSNMLWHEANDFALAEDRIILTVKLKCSSKPQFSQNSILNIGKLTIQDQIKRIITTFKVNIYESDLGTRCVQCNGINHIKMNSNELADIYHKSKVEASSSDYPTHISEDEYLDNFLSDSDSDEAYITHKPIPSKKPQCKTDKGTVIDMDNIHQMLQYYQSNSDKYCLLCDTCGKFQWDGDVGMNFIRNLILKTLNLSEQN